MMTSRTKFALVIAGTAVVCLAIGFFGGRMYSKHQVKTGLRQAVAGLSVPTSAPVAGNGPAGTKSTRASSESAAKVSQRQPLTVALVKKGFVPEDIYNDRFNAYITLGLNFTNETNKSIRAFDGLVTFTDLLGNKVYSSRVAINENVGAGKTLNWHGSIKYNQFVNSHVQLRSEPANNLKVSFKADKVLFTDGTTKEYK